ncbi:hypothetical protein B484DRAFT_253577 [Ochromonadaceae sp. CCMP2298]|nr:hypothetical protein B484DRAFT_253577 [Ochromonadaceae sp. CCMP2298]
MRAMKRGDQEEGQDAQVQAQAQAVAQVTAFYAERLALLEKELLSTSAELGRAKADNARAISVNTTAIAALLPPTPMPVSMLAPVPMPPTPPIPPAAMPAPSGDADVVRHYEQLLRGKEGEREAMLGAHEQRMRALREAHDAHCAQLQSAWEREREGLEKRLREEEERCAELRSELMGAARSGLLSPQAQPQAQVQPQAQPQVEVVYQTQAAPEMRQFLRMEASIEALEGRLKRRERELQGVVEETKAAAQLERARLESLHAQEVREKDEQLVRFQQELLHLVSALKHWQSEGEKGFQMVA